jgi:hypothetical protein
MNRIDMKKTKERIAFFCMVYLPWYKQLFHRNMKNRDIEGPMASTNEGTQSLDLHNPINQLLYGDFDIV